MENALASLKKSTDSLSIGLKNGYASSQQDNLNIELFRAEQQLLLPEGLPRRGWYRHSLYAPGFYTGYGVKTIPGVREAIEQRNWKEAQDEINLTAQAIQRLADYLQHIPD
jgi:N-acetylated-alpha-linked acidic dipeptidase